MEGELSRLESQLETEIRSLLVRGLSRHALLTANSEALAEDCVRACRNCFDELRALFGTPSLPQVAEPGSSHSPALIEDAISEFDLAAQELLHMRFGLGYSFEKIGQVTGIDPDSSRAIISAAVENLRRHPGIREALGF